MWKVLPVAVLLLFCLVNNCIQVFNVPASLRCLIPCSQVLFLSPDSVWWDERFSCVRDGGWHVRSTQDARLQVNHFIRAARSFFASTHFRTGSTFSFFMNNSVYMILVFFFFIAQSRWLLYSSITTHQHCVFSCYFLNIWMPLSLLNSTFD